MLVSLDLSGVLFCRLGLKRALLNECLADLDCRANSGALALKGIELKINVGNFLLCFGVTLTTKGSARTS